MGALLILCQNAFSKRLVGFDIKVEFPLSQEFIHSSFEQIFSEYHVASYSIARHWGGTDEDIAFTHVKLTFEFCSRLERVFLLHPQDKV